MKIFITGVTGFLGRHLALRMLKLGHEVAGNDNYIGSTKSNLLKEIDFYEIDCLDLEEMTKATKGSDIVYHAAAMAHEGLSVFAPYYITNNIFQASISTFTAAIRNNVKKIVFCSSMARYGKQSPPFHEGMEPNPVDPYAIAKVAAENCLKILAEVNKFEYNIAVPHNIVGPYQKYDDPFRNVMSIFINRNLMGKPAIIYGDGSQKRCFSYIDDVIECMEQLALNDKINSEIVNVGPDEEEVSVLELSKMCANVTGYNGEPIFLKDRPQEVKVATCSSDKARKLFNYKTKTTLRESIIKTKEYIIENGVKDFVYHIPLEIINDKTPETWVKKLI